MNLQQFTVISDELKKHCECKGMKVSCITKSGSLVKITLSEQYTRDLDKPNIDYLLWESSRPTVLVGYMRDTWNGNRSDLVRGGYFDFICPIEPRLL